MAEPLLPRRSAFEQVERDFRWKIPSDCNIALQANAEWSRKEPERIAMIGWRPGESLLKTTHGELRSLSGRIANLLRSAGLKRGDRIALILPQGVEVAAAHMAIYRSAMIAVPLTLLFGEDALAFRLASAGAGAIIADAQAAERIAAIRGRIPPLRLLACVGDDRASAADSGAAGVKRGDSRAEALFLPRALEGMQEEFEDQATGPDDPALLVFTSGTTGPPKGALHGHRVLTGHFPGVEMHHDLLPQDGDVAWTPADWAWAGGLLNVLLPCLSLGVPVAYGPAGRFEAASAYRLMEEAGIANAFFPPTALRLLKSAEAKPGDFDLNLRSIGSGGESLGRETWEWAHRELGVEVNEFYGQTECNLILSSCSALGVMKPGAIGKAVPGHRVAAIRQDGEICSAGEIGQLAVSRPDPAMFLGYWNDEKATRDKFVGDWMTTGDQGFVDEDGYFRFLGRDDDVISSAGYRIGPGEIEDCLSSHRAVKLAAAVGKPDSLRGQAVKAYVQLREGFEPSERLAAEIQDYVRSRLSAHLYPREIEFVDSVPLTSTGKAIRRTFRERAEAEAEAERVSGAGAESGGGSGSA